MPDISIFNAGGTAYTIKDAVARSAASAAQTAAANAETAASGAVATAGTALNTAETAANTASTAASTATSAQTVANQAYTIAQQTAELVGSGAGSSNSASAVYQDVSESNGSLSVTTVSMPVAVEINSTIYAIQGMTKSGNVYTIPVAPILAAANLASHAGTWRVWLAQGNDGSNGTNGTTPQRGTDYWTTADINEIKQYCIDQILNASW